MGTINSVVVTHIFQNVFCKKMNCKLVWNNLGGGGVNNDSFFFLWTIPLPNDNLFTYFWFSLSSIRRTKVEQFREKRKKDKKDQKSLGSTLAEPLGNL